MYRSNVYNIWRMLLSVLWHRTQLFMLFNWNCEEFGCVRTSIYFRWFFFSLFIKVHSIWLGANCNDLINNSFFFTFRNVNIGILININSLEYRFRTYVFIQNAFKSILVKQEFSNCNNYESKNKRVSELKVKYNVFSDKLA